VRDIGSLHHYFAGLGQRDAGFAAPQHELLVSPYDQALSIGLDVDLSWLIRQGPIARSAKQSHDQGSACITLFEQQDDLSADVCSMQINRDACGKGGGAWLSGKQHQRDLRIAAESHECPNDDSSARHGRSHAGMTYRRGPRVL
jgi:hypothetical protein